MDIDDLFDRLEREPRERWSLVVQNSAYHTPAMAEALMERAAVYRGTNGGICRDYAHTAAIVTAHLPPRFHHLRALALAELGNAHRSNEDYDSAARRIREAEALLDDQTPIAVKAEVLSFKASLLRDQKMFDAAASNAAFAAATFARAGRVLDQARNIVILGHIHSQARRPRQAQRAFDHALQLLLGDPLLREIDEAPDERGPRYLALVATVQINGLLVGVEMLEAEPDPGQRGRLVETLLLSLWRMKTGVTEALPPHESLNLDWLYGRLMIVDGKFQAAIRILEMVRDDYARECLLVRSADAGEDLLFAYVAKGDLERAHQEAARMLEIYELHELLPDQVAVLEAMVRVNSRVEAARLLRKGQGLPLLSLPRRPRGIPL